MAGFLAKFVGKKILGETLENKFGKEDPYFETVPATRLDGKPSRSGRVTKRKKALPPGISDHDAMILTKVKRRAYRLDMCLFSFAGIHFGWGTVLGFVPAIGDAVDAFLALMVMKTCLKIDGGLPHSLKVKMLVNIIFDFFIGLVPLLGDLADAMFRANTRNAILLEEYLREQGRVYLKKSGQPIPRGDPSDADEFDRREARIAQGRNSHQPSRENSYRSHRSARSPQRSRENSRTRVPQEPAPTQPSRGWFGRSSRRQPDVEIAQVQDLSSGSRRGDRRSRANGSRH